MFKKVLFVYSVLIRYSMMLPSDPVDDHKDASYPENDSG